MSEFTDLLAAVQLLLTRSETLLDQIEIVRLRFRVDDVSDLADLTPEAGDAAVVAGNGHLYVYVEALWQDLGEFKGDAGADGKSIRNGSGAPLDALGVDGDFYVDTANDRFYGPKAGGVWPETYVDLIGPKGDAGWSPVLAEVEDGERRVHQVADWIGGEGTKPVTGQFLGPDGFVETAAEATDIRGPEGPKGDQGDPGAAATIEVGEVTASAPGSAPEVTNVGTPGAAVFNFLLPRGDAGPEAWAEPADWAPDVDYTADPPRSVVTIGGRTYVCLIPHTSGSFSTDLAAGRWKLVAEKGADGAGTGTVQHTGTPAAGQLARFADGSGDLIEGSAGIDADEIVSGVIDPARLPAIAVTDVHVVADETAMLALTAQRGDVAIRTDLPATFILATESPSTLADWKQLPVPTDTVLSVAGLTGSISASSLRTALGLVIGTDVQAHSAILTALAGLSPAADKAAYFTGASAMALADVTAYGRSLWGAADAAAAQALIGAAASTDLLRDMTRVLMAISEMKANQFGFTNGWSDDFSDADGVDGAASTGEVYDGTNKKYTNGSGTNILPTMTGPSAPSGYSFSATAEDLSGQYPAWRAGDGQTTGNANARWSSGGTGAPQTLTISLPAATRIGAYKIWPSSADLNENPKSWVFEGWNGTTWVALDTQTNVPAWSAGNPRTYILSGAPQCSQYRVRITANFGSTAYITVQEIELLDFAAIDLRSTAFAATISVPTEMALVSFVKMPAGAVLNTDLKGYVSRDGGATWTQVTLAAAETIGGYTALEAFGASVTAQPSGTSPKWRITGAGGFPWDITGAVIRPK